MSKYLTMKVSASHVARVQAHAAAALVLAPGADTGADLTKWCGSVFNQLNEGSCTACTTRDILLWKQNKYGYPKVVDPSVNAIYYFGRQIFGDLLQDGGATVNDSFEGTILNGVIPASADVYDKSTLYVAPSLTDVVFKSVKKTALVPTTASIRASLDSGEPVGISVAVMKTLFTPAIMQTAQGMLPVVDVSDIVPNEGHAIGCFKYFPDPVHTYIYGCEGSWGEEYGDKGFFYFTEAALQKTLWEVVQLDIPQTPPTKAYALSASFTAPSVTPGTVNPFTVKATLNGAPISGQTITVTQVRTDTGTTDTVHVTDATGTFSISPRLNIEGTDVVTVSWTPDDGVLRTITMQATWSNNPAPAPMPPTPPTPTPVPVPPAPVPVYKALETDLVEHHVGRAYNGDTYVPPALWQQVGQYTKMVDNEMNINGQTYPCFTDSGVVYVHYKVMKDAGYTLTHIATGGWTFTK